MSGFAGFIDNAADIAAKENIIKKMADKIVHRGPEGENFYADEKIALGFRRLNSGGFICNKDLILCCDGVIYNFKELRTELENKGHTFAADADKADKEVILHGYEEYGEAIAGKLRGMFSFIIYNRETGKIYGARDHFGIKPFYYYLKDDIFMFGSEIKSFLPHPKFKKEINAQALKMYLIFQYSVLEETFFKGVFKLTQGCYFTYENNKLTVARYFDIDYKTEEKSFGEYMQIISETVESSVEYHKAGDFEAGSFLSGGVDSSYIATLAKPGKSFSVGFDVDGFDESMYARELSDILKINNYKKIVSSDEFFDALPKVQYHSDEPHANLSCVPLYYLSKMAAEQVKTALSGEGADEFFAGYLPFAESKFTHAYLKLPFGCRKFIANGVRLMPDFKGKAGLIKYGQNVEDYYIGQAFIMGGDEADGILAGKYKSGMSYKDVTAPIFEQVKGCSDLVKKMYLDLFLWLPNDILLKADRMSMAHSLEVRMPLLDREVFALASKIPAKYLIKDKVTKYIFREVANKVIPDEWAKRQKLGFPVPFALWLREQKYFDILKSMFDEDFTGEFFNRGKLFALLDEHFNSKRNNGRKLYTIYSFLLWYKIYFIENQEN